MNIKLFVDLATIVSPLIAACAVGISSWLNIRSIKTTSEAGIKDRAFSVRKEIYTSAIGACGQWLDLIQRLGNEQESIANVRLRLDAISTELLQLMLISDHDTLKITASLRTQLGASSNRIFQKRQDLSEVLARHQAAISEGSTISPEFSSAGERLQSAISENGRDSAETKAAIDSFNEVHNKVQRNMAVQRGIRVNRPAAERAIEAAIKAELADIKGTLLAWIVELRRSLDLNTEDDSLREIANNFD
jgi:hypothetical protein